MASQHHAARWSGSGKRAVRANEPPPAPSYETYIPPPPEPIEEEGPLATDAARALADEHGIDLATVEGTGAEGRITKDDVTNVLEQATAPQPEDEEDDTEADGD